MIYNTDKDCYQQVDSNYVDVDDDVNGKDDDNQSYRKHIIRKKRKFEKDYYHDQMPSSAYKSIEEVIQLLLHVTKKNPSNSTHHHDGIETLLMCNSTYHTCKIVSLLLHSVQAAQRRSYPLLSSDAMIENFETYARIQENERNRRLKATLTQSNMNGDTHNNAGDFDDGVDDRNVKDNMDYNNSDDDDDKVISDDDISHTSLKRKLPIGFSSFHPLQLIATNRYNSLKKPRNIKRDIHNTMQLSQLCNQHTSLFTNEWYDSEECNDYD